MIKHKILFIVTLLFFIMPNCYAADQTDSIIKKEASSLGISNLFSKSSSFFDENFSGIDLNEFLNNAIKGKMDFKELRSSIIKLLFKEFRTETNILFEILVVIVINSILNCITDNLENKGVSKITYYVQYILIIGIVLKNYLEIIASVKESVENIIAVSNLLIPILITLIISTGNVTSAGTLEPIIVFMVSLIGNFIKNFALPLIMISTSIGIVSKISDKIQLDKLAKILKSSTMWLIGIILTLFVTVVSLDGSLSSSVDVVTAKTTKAAVSNMVPMVGKILGDAVDSVIGCSNILKNAVGVCGVVIVVIIVAEPIIKILVIMFLYYILSAVTEPIADKKIVSIFSLMGDTFKILFAFICSIAMTLIIGITIIIKISGKG